MNFYKYNKFLEKLQTGICTYESNFSNIIILCIGTDKIIGDSIGPIIGSKLKKIENEYIRIYGTIGKNLNFLNTKEILEQIYVKYKNPFLITIDAALSKNANLGEIYISKGYIKLGNALEKSIKFYSNINIKCVVGKYENINQRDNIKTLKNVTLKEIYNMAEIVYRAIENIYV